MIVGCEKILHDRVFTVVDVADNYFDDHMDNVVSSGTYQPRCEKLPYYTVPVGQSK